MTRRTRLSISPLEGRDVPSGPGDVLLAGPINVPAALAAPNRAPVISNFRAIVGPNGQVTFTGTVSDDTPVAGYVVQITGPGISVSAVVQKDGTFSVTTTATGSTDVMVSAQTTDSSGATSTPVYTTFLPSA
jgi:hypothetical protein